MTETPLVLQDLDGEYDLVDLKICSVSGVRADVRQGESLPEEWAVTGRSMSRQDGSLLQVRLIARAAGPGGELTIDGLASFHFSSPLADIADDLLGEFIERIAMPVILPLTRVWMMNLSQAMQLGVPMLNSIVQVSHRDDGDELAG